MVRETDDIPLVVVGCDFRVAATSWRERMILGAGERLELFRTLGRLDGQAGLVALVTCNRCEWIVSAGEPEWVGNLLFSHLHYLWEDMSRERGTMPVPYVTVGREAARHVFRVVAGLESFVMGEQQIARQFHMAVKGARDEGTSTAILNGLEKIAGAMTKKLRERGMTRRQSVGIHSIAAGAIAGRFLDRAAGGKGTVAVVGMGQIGRKVAGLLEGSGRWKVIRVNRTVRSQGWVPLGKLAVLQGDVDGIVFCTGSDRPVCRLSDIGRRKKRGKRLWIVDIGVPAQLAVDRKPVSGVEVVGLDRLVEGPSDAMVADRVRQVEQEVDGAVRSFEVFCRERSMVSFLSAAQSLHRQYIGEVIPDFVEKNYSHLAAADRKEMISRMRRLLIDYWSRLIEHFHSVFGME